MELAEHLAVPYRLRAFSARTEAGTWQRFVEYPELGCVASADSPEEAMERADDKRAQLIMDRFLQGEPIPPPRPPLSSLLSEAHEFIREKAPIPQRSAQDPQ